MPLGDPNQMAVNVESTPAAPRLVYVRKSGVDQESPASSSLTKAASELKSAQKLSQYLLTAGSILEGVLLSGMDAPTSAAAKKNPYPALIRIKKEAILPNYYRQNVRECFVIVSGFGELSSERARLRTERVSCVRNDGTVMESDISGYVTGEDGKVGVRGRLVTKQGAVIAKSLAAGALAGFGENISPTAISQLSLDSSTAPRLVMMIGTLYLTHIAMSCCKRSFDLCTIWLMAKGAAGLSGLAALYAAKVSVISFSHSSSCSAGRAFNAGIEPTTPAIHCAMTSLGLLMMNSGEPMMGKGKWAKAPGKCDFDADMTSPMYKNELYPAYLLPSVLYI